ncbi:MAG: ATP-binding protein [Planctomycetes bacterium]|nr:ATP-binding protein [Planctomycetota bacterium]
MLLDGIVEHAVERARPGGAIAITARMAGQFVRIAITDPSDEGAPQDAAPDPPVQSAAAMALPLVIARELARRHGGEFYIKNGLQPGTQFVVDLPLPVQSARR